LRTVFGLALLAAAAIVAVLLEPAPETLAGRARASDGDSIRIGEQRLRLVGLDAPELDQTCTDAAGATWACGRIARQRMEALLAAGPVSCTGEGRDRYSRILATCRVDGRDIAATMVTEGLAIDTGRYGSEERLARAGRTGLWAGRFVPPRQWRDEGPEAEMTHDWRDWLRYWFGQLTGATTFR
jgi:endonuclease YncB( thermonuclease family)